MGLQDVFFALRLPFDSAEARELSTRIAEEIYLTALEASARAGRASTGRTRRSPRPAPRTGELQPDLWGVTGTQTERWAALRERVAEHGLRNSLLIAIAPTATIASIAGCYECIEPQVSNLFKRETLSGEFLQVNTALVRELKARGLWTPEVREAIKRADGSVQGIAALPDGRPRAVPHRLGAAAAGADRPGGRAVAVHRPEPVAQPVPGRARRSASSLDVPATPGSPG